MTWPCKGRMYELFLRMKDEWRYSMSKTKRIISVLACTVLVLAIALSASAEAGIARVSGTTRCDFCGAAAQLSQIKPTGNYRNNGSTHEESVLVYYYCAKRHQTVKEDSIGGQRHFVGSYTDLGHTGPASDTHQYWVTCPCGHQENVYIVGCDYKNTGVHKTP